MDTTPSGDSLQGNAVTQQLTSEERIAALESRVSALEALEKKVQSALLVAAKGMLKNPMAAAMMPKEMRADLKKMIDETPEAKS